MMTALETFELPRHPVDTVGDLRAQTELQRTGCGPTVPISGVAGRPARLERWVYIATLVVSVVFSGVVRIVANRFKREG